MNLLPQLTQTCPPTALTNAEKDEEKYAIEAVLKELAMSAEKIPDQPLEGDWQ